MGDLTAALATFDRIDGFIQTPRDLSREARFALERLLIENNRAPEAISRAYARQDAVALAELAALID